LRDRIERRKAEGWQFVFPGADIDAYAVARSLGVLEESTVSYSGASSVASMATLAEEPALFARGQAGRVRCLKAGASLGTYRFERSFWSAFKMPTYPG